VIVNNSTNIKGKNNYTSPQIIEHNIQHIGMEIEILAWDRLNNVAVLNQSLRS